MQKKIYLFSISSHPDAININSLDITFLKPTIDFKKYDYFIITSKQVSIALSQYNKSDYIFKKALCISTQTANSYKELGGDVLEIGAGYGDNLIDKIKSYPKETKWLYLRAKVVASDFVNKCNDIGYYIDESVLYSSDCSEKILSVNIEESATLIFTSPSSVKCFLKNNKINKRNSIIVIGSTTARILPKDIKFKIAKENTIESCFRLI